MATQDQPLGPALSSPDELGVFRRQEIVVGPVRLHAVVGGRPSSGSRLVLLLHGFLGSWWTWRKVLPTLAADHRVAALDLRGYGDSSKPADGYDVATVAGDIAATIEELGATSAAIVAHDMAAPPALYLARTRPDLVDRLAYLDEPVYGVNFTELTGVGSPLGQPLWWFPFHAVPGLPEALIAGREEAYVRWFHDHFLAVPDAITDADRAELLRVFAADGGVPGALGCYRAVPQSLRQYADLADAPRLTLPLLGLGGDHSLGRQVAGWLREVGDDVRGGAVADCGHFIPEEQPAALMQHLIPFLAA